MRADLKKETEKEVKGDMRENESEGWTKDGKEKEMLRISGVLSYLIALTNSGIAVLVSSTKYNTVFQYTQLGPF